MRAYSTPFVSISDVGMHAKSLQSCSTLFNPMDCSLPGSFVHGILQARIPEWVAMPSSRVSLTQGSYSCLLQLLHCRWILYYGATSKAQIRYLNVNPIPVGI